MLTQSGTLNVVYSHDDTRKILYRNSHLCAQIKKIIAIFCTRHGESFHFLLQKIAKELVQKWESYGCLTRNFPISEPILLRILAGVRNWPESEKQELLHSSAERVKDRFCSCEDRTQELCVKVEVAVLSPPSLTVLMFSVLWTSSNIELNLPGAVVIVR